MTQRTMVVLGATLVLAAGGLGCEHARHDGGAWVRRRALDRVDHVLDHVNATDAQRTRAKVIVGRALTELEPWPAAARRLRGDLEAAWRTETPDRAALHRRVDEEVESLRMLGHALVDDGLELHGVLTSEQRGMLARMRGGRADG